MLAAPNLLDKRDWTVDEVAKLPEDLPYELIDGRLILSPSPMAFHQFIGRQIMTALDTARPRGIFVGYDLSVQVDNGSEPRPDVVALRAGGLDRIPLLATDVLLAIEIISPESAVRDRRDKMKLYAYAGIPAYWIIDPQAERITFTEWLLSEGGAYHQHVHTDGLVTIDRPWETTLDMRGWAEEWADLRGAARPNG